MTRIIKITTVAAAFLLLLGSYFKINHWWGADVALISGAASSMVTLLLLIYTIPSKLQKGTEQLGAIVTSVTLMLGMLALVFKFLHWPGAAKLIWATDLGIIISAIVWLLDLIREKDEAKVKLKVITFFFILTLILIIGLMS
jgi:hypothetical protein